MIVMFATIIIDINTITSIISICRALGPGLTPTHYTYMYIYIYI